MEDSDSDSDESDVDSDYDHTDPIAANNALTTDLEDLKDVTSYLAVQVYSCWQSLAPEVKEGSPTSVLSTIRELRKQEKTQPEILRSKLKNMHTGLHSDIVDCLREILDVIHGLKKNPLVNQTFTDENNFAADQKKLWEYLYSDVFPDLESIIGSLYGLRYLDDSYIQAICYQIYLSVRTFQATPAKVPDLSRLDQVPDSQLEEAQLNGINSICLLLKNIAIACITEENEKVLKVENVSVSE